MEDFGVTVMTNNRDKAVGQEQPMDSGAARTRKNDVKTAKLGREVQARLGQQLRAIYDDVVNQGVPDRFADLLKQLDNKDNKDRS